MKSAFKISALSLLLVAFLSNCKKDDNSNSSVSGIIVTGSWRVSYFHENSEDHTNDFSGYNFQFNSNGTMSAISGGITTNGTWKNDDSNNEFHMTIGSSSPLSDISKGWIVISKTNTEFNLKDDNSSGNEELHFIKN
jgi:hypothetical protein